MSLPRLAAATLLCAACLFSQTPTAVVNGSVVDPTGASVPDAKVSVINQETNVASTKNTNAEGAFTIVNLLPGNYILTVEKSLMARAEAVLIGPAERALTRIFFGPRSSAR